MRNSIQSDLTEVSIKFIRNSAQSHGSTHRCCTITTHTHIELMRSRVLNEIDLPVLEHPPYRPGFAPCNFRLFSEMKIKLKGRYLPSEEAIMANLVHGLVSAYGET